MLKFGTITEILASKGMARVKFDDDGIVSAPLHISAGSTLNDQAFFPFFINQHVWCHMDEQCERGVIGGAVYDEANPPTGGDENVIMVNFKDGLSLKYDRSAKKLSVTGTGDVEINTNGKLDATVSGDAKVITSGTAEVQASTEVKLTAPITTVSGVLKCASIQTTGPAGSGLTIDASGNLKTPGSLEGATVKEGAIQLGTHKHLGVTTGSGTSGTPTP